MDSQEIFANIRDLLADFYPDLTSARRVVADAGIDPRHIAFSPHALNNWHMILDEAIKKGKVGPLLDIVSEEYKKHQGWHDACISYGEFVARGGQLATFTSQDLIQNKYKIDFHKGVQGVVQGDHATVTMNFPNTPKEES